MKRIGALWRESLCGRGLRWLAGPGAGALADAFFASCLWAVWTWIDRKILRSPLLRWLFDPAALTEAWYASAFCRGVTRQVRRLSNRIPRPAAPWRAVYPGLFLSALLLVPQGFWAPILPFAGFFLLAAVYFAHHAQTRAGVSFALVFWCLLLFAGLLALAVPYRALLSLCYLLLGIGFFFLISFAVRTQEAFLAMLRCVYLTLLALCCVGLVQQTALGLSARATLSDGVAFGEILVLLFPFAFICPRSFSTPARRIAHLVLLLILVFNVVTATHSRAAFVGFSVELLLLILLIDWRYLPLLLLLTPAITRTALDNIAQMWEPAGAYRGFFANIIRAFRGFWSNGFGISRTAILDAYNSTALRAGTGQPLVQIPYLQISPVYFSMLLEAGALALVVFVSYLLRLAHSALTSLFTAPEEYRPYFAAGLATLLGISLASMVESTLLAPRTLLAYWGMLGLLRAARGIRYGLPK